MSPQNVLVVGAGSWGTALAVCLARVGHPVSLWGRNTAVLKQINAGSTPFLPGVMLPEKLQAEGDLAVGVARSQAVVVAVPSHALRETFTKLRKLDVPGLLINAAKGFETGSGKLPHQVAAEVIPGSVYTVISGPSFAAEVARGQPTALTIAGTEWTSLQQAQRLLHGEALRVYTTTDLLGVEMGAALKNVFAIAAGIADGLGYGANTRTALITRGLAELMRLGAAMGANQQTLMGLSGVGDLILTCTDNQSRNRQMGLALADGLNVDQAAQRIGRAVEGVRTAHEVARLAESLDVDMPIVVQVSAVLNSMISAAAAVRTLLSREPRAESF